MITKHEVQTVSSPARPSRGWIGFKAHLRHSYFYLVIKFVFCMYAVLLFRSAEQVVNSICPSTDFRVCHSECLQLKSVLLVIAL